jgi:hypothetical protein
MQTDQEKYNTLMKLEPIAREGAARRVIGLDLPKDSPTQFMSDAIEHPELFNKFPEMETAMLRLKHDPTDPMRGEYARGDMPLLSVNSAPFYTGNSPANSGPLGTALHEGSHFLQHRYDMPGGAASSSFRRPPEVWAQAQRGLDLAGPIDARLRQQWESLLRQKSNPQKLYADSPGEQMARLAQERMRMSQFNRNLIDPNEQLTDFQSAVDPEFARKVLDYSQNSISNSIDPKYIIEALRKSGHAR